MSASIVVVVTEIGWLIILKLFERVAVVSTRATKITHWRKLGGLSWTEFAVVIVWIVVVIVVVVVVRIDL